MTKKIIIKIYIFIIIYIHGYFKLNNIFKDLNKNIIYNFLKIFLLLI